MSADGDAGPGGATLRRLRLRSDASGSLAFAEAGCELPFVPQRLFTVWDVAPEGGRGRHAHRRCEQFLICVSGSLRALVETPAGSRSYRLDSPSIGLHVPAMVWTELHDHIAGTVLVVLASHPYDEADYIRDHGAFLAEARLA